MSHGSTAPFVTQARVLGGGIASAGGATTPTVNSPRRYLAAPTVEAGFANSGAANNLPMMGAEAAEAVVDEVTLLEAALREATQRKRHIGGGGHGGAGVYMGSPLETMVGDPREQLRYAAPQQEMNFVGMPGMPTAVYGDQATQAYGAQLKAWIDMQVDARLNVVIPSLLDRELSSFQQESAAGIRMYQCLEDNIGREIDLVKGAQAKLLAVVEGLSDEVVQLKVQGEALAAMEKIMLTVEELQQSVAARDRDPAFLEQLSLHEGAIAEIRGLHQNGYGELQARFDEMRRLHDALHSRHETGHSELQSRSLELQHLHNGLAGRHDKHEESIADILSALAETRSLHGDLQDRHQTGFAELQRLYGETQSHHKRSIEEIMEQMRHRTSSDETNAMMGLRQEVADVVNMISQHETRLSAWRTEITAEVGEELKAIDALQQSDAKKNQDFHRLMTELRAETSSAFRSEAAAVAALDEQLWLTDQRLGQRIDELAHSHRESITVVERRIGGVLQNRLNARDRAEAATILSPVSSSPLRQRLEATTTGNEAVRIARRINIEGGSVKDNSDGVGTLHVSAGYRPLREASRTLNGRSLLRANDEAETEVRIIEESCARTVPEESRAQYSDEAQSNGGLRPSTSLRTLAARRLRGTGDDDEVRADTEVREYVEYGKDDSATAPGFGTRRLLRAQLR